MKFLVKISPIIARLGLTALLLFISWKACLEFFFLTWGMGTWLGHFSLKLGPAFFLFVLICILIFIVVGAALWLPEKIRPWMLWLGTWRSRLRWACWLMAAVVLIIPMWLLQYSYWGTVFTGTYMRLLLLLSIGVIVGVLTTSRKEPLFIMPDMVVGLLLAAASFTLGWAFTGVVNYPFGLSWSEGNRIWDYSVLFGHRLYNYPADKPIFAFIDLGRQALWGLPFLLSKVSITQVRLWDALVSTIPYAVLGWVVFQRDKKHFSTWLLVGVWTFLFLNQGQIYTPLVLSAILVAIAWRRPLWIALPLIVLAGYFAQLARFTWMFAPAIWAGMLYIADNPPDVGVIAKQKVITSASAVLAGFLGGYLIPHLFKTAQTSLASLSADTLIMSEVSPDTQVISVAGLEHVISRQPLLWERLLPNQTFGPGILLGLFWATAPLIVLLIYLVWSRRWRLHWLQGAALVGALLVFLGVGLVVSVKIGGGSNLHNLDMFLIGLVFVAALAWKAVGGQALVHLEQESIWVQSLLALMMFLYVFPYVRGATPLGLPSDQTVQKALTEIRQQVEDASKTGEVLFIDQRQLLTFGDVPKIPLVVDFEKKYMMDKAMSSDVQYFQPFYEALAQRRYALIVSEPLKENIHQTDYQFGDENNAWVKWVSGPLLCYYRPESTFKSVKVQLLVPREGGSDCPELQGLKP